MNAIEKRFKIKLSIILAAALAVSQVAPSWAASKTVYDSVLISSFTDRLGGTYINVGKAEGITVGAKGIILRDDKQIATYEVKQVDWGRSLIEVSDLLAGYSIQPGDKAPITSVPHKTSSGSKKKKLWTAVGIAAAVIGIILLAKRGRGGDEAAAQTTGTITLTAQKTTSGEESTVTITATVKKADGDPAPDGTSVIFSTTAGQLDRTQVTTQAGRATTTLRPEENGGAETATVTAKALGASASITVSFVSSIKLQASPTSIQALNSGGSQTQSIITATCTDAAGNPATSGNVEFTTSLGNITKTAPIGADGKATATLTSTTPGTATVTATWSKSTATVDVVVTAGPPYSLSVTSNTSSLQCDGHSFATISATVKDIAGNPATDGTVVNFSVIPDASGGGNGTITPQSVTSGGVATATLFTRDATGNVSKAGTATVNCSIIPANQPATVPAPASTIENSATKVKFVSTQVAGIQLGANPTNIRGWDTVDNKATITAVVYNAERNPVPDGTAVHFIASHGIIYGTGNNPGGVSTTTNGVATATLVSDASGNSSWNGRVDITAISGGVTVTQPGLVIFSGPPSPSRCKATISQSTLPSVGGQALITVEALDINGNPVVDGTKVTAITDKGTVNPVGSGTTTGGQAVFTLATSTNSSSPTPTGNGTVTISIDSGGKNAETGGLPVTLTVSFTVN